MRRKHRIGNIQAAGVVAAALSSTCTWAQSATPLDAMAFLAGYCWSAPFPDGTSTDTHCFEWVYGNHQLRDRHSVSGSGTEYGGETLYLVDGKTQRIIYRYVDATGGRSDGHVEAGDGVLHFPEDRYIANTGQEIVFVTEWRRLDDRSYSVTTRQRVGEMLRDIFSFKFERVGSTGSMPST